VEATGTATFISELEWGVRPDSDIVNLTRAMERRQRSFGATRASGFDG